MPRIIREEELNFYVHFFSKEDREPWALFCEITNDANGLAWDVYDLKKSREAFLNNTLQDWFIPIEYLERFKKLYAL